MHIFIDESGTFSHSANGTSSVSAVGALVIPSTKLASFDKLYGRLRAKLPKHNGEVKGRLLSEAGLASVVSVLYKLGCIFEAVATDSSFHTPDEILAHRKGQEQKITKHLTEEHHPNLVREVTALRAQLSEMPIQLYLQAVAMSELVYHTMNHANLFYCTRLPQELGSYHWRIDGKNRIGITQWEDWWHKVVLPVTESKTVREPMIAMEGGDYRWHDQFRVEPSEYKKQFMPNTERHDCYDLNRVLREDFSFSSDIEYGLEAADILVNALRRSLAGNYTRQGWLSLRSLMIHRKQHYVHMISLGKETGRVKYSKVLDDLLSGGRSMLPPNYGRT